MEFKLTIDFSDRAVQALAAIAEALRFSNVKPEQSEIAQNAPETRLDIQPAPVQAEAENVQPEPPQLQSVAVSPDPAEAQEEDAKTEKTEDDPMQGMSVMRAMQVLLDEIDEKGIDMADVNARIRAKAQELNLSYPSGTILMKAIGYVETRKIALGL